MSSSTKVSEGIPWRGVQLENGPVVGTGFGFGFGSGSGMREAEEVVSVSANSSGSH